MCKKHAHCRTPPGSCGPTSLHPPLSSLSICRASLAGTPSARGGKGLLGHGGAQLALALLPLSSLTSYTICVGPAPLPLLICKVGTTIRAQASREINEPNASELPCAAGAPSSCNWHFLHLTHFNERAEEADGNSQGRRPPCTPPPLPHLLLVSQRRQSRASQSRVFTHPALFESLERFAKDQTPGVYHMSARGPGIFSHSASSGG